MVRRLGISILVLTALAIALLAASPTQAGDYGCGSYLWSSPYPTSLAPLHGVGAIPLPPYFALHPPVYYEMPVPRTYGYSPWAYPPYVMTPEISEPVPEIIQNQYIPQPAKQVDEKAKMAASVPRIIRNPFVVASEGQTDSVLAAK